MSRSQPVPADESRRRILVRLLFFAALSIFILLGWWAIPWPVYAGIFSVSLTLYALIWFSRPKSLAVFDYLHAAVDLVLLTTLLRFSGGANSAFDIFAYIWLFGVVYLNMHRGERTLLPLLSLLAWLALALGAWGSVGWGRFLAFHALGISLASLVALNFLKERSQNRMDSLTKILHRRAGVEELNRLIQRAQPFSLAFIDLRKFKEINDEYGHAVGDEVLNVTAMRIAGVIRKEDVFMRYGGDEFVVASQLGALRPRLETAFMEPFRTSVGLIQVVADIGVEQWQPGMVLDSLLSAADEAMYIRKRDRIVKETLVLEGYPDSDQPQNLGSSPNEK